jgi:hypothetical protein
MLAMILYSLCRKVQLLYGLANVFGRQAELLPLAVYLIGSSFYRRPVSPGLCYEWISLGMALRRFVVAQAFLFLTATDDRLNLRTY